MPNASKLMLRLGVLAVGAMTLMGCQTIRDATGLSKDPPDEFAVATKAPLVVPPEFNLMPPREGAPPTNQIEPTESAQSALFDPADPASAAKSIAGDYSEAEKILLANAGAAKADPSIRQQIAADGRAMEAADDNFTNEILFWRDPTDQGVNVDADAEAKRMDAQKNGGVAAPKKPAESVTIDSKNSSDSKGGWFDWLF
ncbi:MAG TPA: DUF3035 domain-containing protein [Rhizomicrobium sp.]|nr:DUF3035 domain-containing protein [Rhizomicrobium sp.]